MYIHHLTLATGHLTRIERGDVEGETLARMGPWLAVLTKTATAMPLPTSALTGFSALSGVYAEGLMITISGPPAATGRMQGKAPPLVTMAVAKRARHADALWPLITGPVMPQVKPGVIRPPEPWCAVAIHPTIMMHPESMEWLGDLERCVAWAWVSRNGPMYRVA